MSRHVLAVLLTSLLLGLAVAASADARVPGKKLIEYGWDVPNPSYVAQNIRAMEARPFEGLMMRISPIGSIFAHKQDTEAQAATVAAEIEAMRQIKWEKFTDNFLMMYAASEMDWFSDADWVWVLRNVQRCAEAAVAGRCRGVVFDAEPYGKNPWHYPTQAQAATKSFDEYQAQARKRGAQFVDQIEKIMDDPVIHTFFLLGYFGGFVDEPDAAVRAQGYKSLEYGLLPAFLDGMLDAVDPGTIITDGNEPAYYYTNAEQYQKIRDLVKNKAWKLVSPENQAKYREHVQMSQALYVDHLWDLRTSKNISEHMTQEERGLWFQHNVYHALDTADEFVWLYSEKMDWWYDRGIPAGLPESVVAAKEKLAKGEPLGYDLAPIIERATKLRRAALAGQVLRRSADVAALTVPAPTIDGVLSDEAWRQVSALDAFVPYLGVKTEPGAQTLAWITYDVEKLYVAVYCFEPRMEDLVVVGSARDSDVWLGDSVDLFVALGGDANTYHHIILSPANLSWDARWAGKDDLTWNPKMTTATSRGDGYWSAEIALPWRCMRRPAPKPGEVLQGNICRQRLPGKEQTTWSQCVSGFVEPESFGAWTFR